MGQKAWKDHKEALRDFKDQQGLQGQTNVWKSPYVSYTTSFPLGPLPRRNLCMKKRWPGASNGQQYPLPLIRIYECVQQGKGYCWLLLAPNLFFSYFITFLFLLYGFLSDALFAFRHGESQPSWNYSPKVKFLFGIGRDWAGYLLRMMFVRSFFAGRNVCLGIIVQIFR